VFSSSFTISATRHDETGTTVVDLPVERAATSVDARSMPPTTLGMFPVCHRSLPGSTRSGENARKKSVARLEPALLEHRLQDLFGRAGIGRGLEDDELPAAQVRCHLLDGRDDVREVGVLRLAQRRGDADVDRVRLARAPQKSAVARRRPAATSSAMRRRGHVGDVGLAPVDGVDLRELTSTLVTSNPALASSVASGRPT
jgi:hypothetical protein